MKSKIVPTTSIQDTCVFSSEGNVWKPEEEFCMNRDRRIKCPIVAHIETFSSTLLIRTTSPIGLGKRILAPNNTYERYTKRSMERRVRDQYTSKNFANLLESPATVVLFQHPQKKYLYFLVGRNQTTSFRALRFFLKRKQNL
jgi:hypothetical protein